MKKIHCTTSTSEETTFSISICENLGWIEPVFLLLSPNLKENLHLSQEPDSFLRVNHFEIKKPLISNHRHNEDERENTLIEKLRDGKNIAVVSDAGTPRDF